MSHNPFDDFADDFRAAIPAQQIPCGNQPSSAEAMGHMSATGAPTRNTLNPLGQPVQAQPFSQELTSNNNSASLSGISTGMGIHGAPPTQQNPVIGGPGGSSTGMYYPSQPHQTQPSAPTSSLVPTTDGTASSPYASMLGQATDQQGQGMASQIFPQGSSSIVQPLPSGLQGGSSNTNPFQAIPSGTGPTPAPAAPSNIPVDTSNPFAAPSVPGLVPTPAPPGPAPSTFQDSVQSLGIGPTGGASYGGPPGSQSDAQQLLSQHPTAMVQSNTGQFDPISMPGAPPAATDPFGAAASQTSSGGFVAGALVPASQPVDDPFGVFAAPTVPGPAPATVAATVSPSSDDPWADMGFGPPVPDASTANDADGAPPSASGGEVGRGEASSSDVKAASRSPGELPPGGEWYDARIFTPTLGVMFFKPQELTDSLFLQTDKALVDALDDRPVVAFIVEGSSARSAGVELGHVLLKVNGIDVKNPKEASRLIKEGPRPLPLLFYVPDTTVVVAEGEHMVKYDTRETGAPNSAKDWKPKYVVIGGIIAQPWMMNMYRSKVSGSFLLLRLIFQTLQSNWA